MGDPSIKKPFGRYVCPVKGIRIFYLFENMITVYKLKKGGYDIYIIKDRENGIWNEWNNMARIPIV